MARGELVPDDVVVGIVADRIDQPDARQRLHPRRLPAHRAAGRGARPHAQEKGLKLDGVIELKVDEDILIRRIETRAFEMRAMGSRPPGRQPGCAQAASGCLSAQTAPLVAHYKGKGALRTVDGMASIAEVTGAIGRALADAAVFGAPRSRPKPQKCFQGPIASPKASKQGQSAVAKTKRPRPAPR